MKPDQAQPPRSKYVTFGGGLDTQTAALRMAPGALIGSSNYEASILGGYERFPGYVRFDGRTDPCDAEVTVFSGVFTCTVGQTVTGITSAATGVVAYVSASVVVLTKVVGTFTVGETLLVSGSPVGVVAAEPSLDALTLNAYYAAAEDIYRADIAAVTGSGAIRGIAILKDVVYAWRNNAGGTAQAIYKSTTGGWVNVPLYNEVSFTGGSVEPTEGATITQGANSATVKRVVVESGTWGGSNAAGRFIVTTPSPGNFAAGALTAGGTATLSGAQTAITLNPSGRWIWRRYNFAGQLDTLRLYGVDGANKPCEFDGDVLVPLNTGMTAGLYPSCVEVHKNHLFVSYRGSLQHSGIGEPYQWSVLTGASELGLGDDITGLLSVAGNEAQSALLVTCKNRFGALYGSDPADFVMVPISLEAGARAYSLEQIDRAVALDDAGVRDFRPTQNFGNYSSNSLTAHVQRRTTSLSPVASMVDRKRTRYRLFFANGGVLTGTPGKRWSWLFSTLPITVNVAHEGEIAGESRMFIGASNGMVYEIADCRSFDGTAIEAWIKTAFTHMDEPGRRKAFRRFDLEARGQSAGQVSFTPEFSYGEPETDPGYMVTTETPAPPMQWDIDAWDSGVWDGQYAQALRLRVPGIGENVSMIVYSNSANQLPHELTGCGITYIPRRAER